jgi:periplasmic glucans biosynthesis protein
MRRRDFLKSAAILGAASMFPDPLQADPARTLPIGKPQPFDFAWLKGHARVLAGASYQPAQQTLSKTLDNLDYDQYQAIRFRTDRAQWAGDGLDFRVEFFHPGPMFKEPVRMHEVVNQRAREIIYDPAMFDFRKSGINIAALPKDIGFAGFRVHFHTDWSADVAAFLGASYFRAVGEDFRQYGISARASDRHGARPRRKVPAVHHLLAGTSSKGFRLSDRLRAVEFAERGGRLSL